MAPVFFCYFFAIQQEKYIQIVKDLVYNDTLTDFGYPS